ncbi:MAG: acetylglutamate kinase [Bacillota bacterium]|nr:acetylglutamate kinase [Bacillota bacterium]
MNDLATKVTNGLSSMEKAEVIVEALPYIKMFFGKTVLIKYGGAAMTDAALKEMVALDIVLLRYIGMKPVIVHGGGREITDVMRRLGKEPVFVNGLRVTDGETAEIAEMVLTGRINQDIVGLINRGGAKALGLSGKDANLVVAHRKGREPVGTGGAGGAGGAERGDTGDATNRTTSTSVDLGYVGSVAGINTEIIDVVCREGFIPVISPVACDDSGATLNINADHLAGHIAGALGAYKLVVLTDVEGILADPSDPGSLVPQVTVGEAREMIADGRIGSGMIPKVDACITALERGVPRTHIIDGRKPHSLLLEMFTNRGIGTMIIGGQGWSPEAVASSGSQGAREPGGRTTMVRSSTTCGFVATTRG